MALIVCEDCGKKYSDKAEACPNCGYTNAPASPVRNNNANVSYDIPNEYRPISAWGYFGYQILFAIPLVGFIMLIVFACGGTQNINLRNFARSYFCMLVLALIFIGMAAALGVFAALTF